MCFFLYFVFALYFLLNVPDVVKNAKSLNVGEPQRTRSNAWLGRGSSLRAINRLRLTMRCLPLWLLSLDQLCTSIVIRRLRSCPGQTQGMRTWGTALSHTLKVTTSCTEQPMGNCPSGWAACFAQLMNTLPRPTLWLSLGGLSPSQIHMATC